WGSGFACVVVGRQGLRTTTCHNASGLERRLADGGTNNFRRRYGGTEKRSRGRRRRAGASSIQCRMGSDLSEEHRSGEEGIISRSHHELWNTTWISAGHERTGRL